MVSYLCFHRWTMVSSVQHVEIYSDSPSLPPAYSPHTLGNWFLWWTIEKIIISWPRKTPGGGRRELSSWLEVAGSVSSRLPAQENISFVYHIIVSSRKQTGRCVLLFLKGSVVWSERWNRGRTFTLFTFSHNRFVFHSLFPCEIYWRNIKKKSVSHGDGPNNFFNNTGKVFFSFLQTLLRFSRSPYRGRSHPSSINTDALVSALSVWSRRTRQPVGVCMRCSWPSMNSDPKPFTSLSDVQSNCCGCRVWLAHARPWQMNVLTPNLDLSLTASCCKVQFVATNHHLQLRLGCQNKMGKGEHCSYMSQLQHTGHVYL